jgi:hypothetical protein
MSKEDRDAALKAYNDRLDKDPHNCDIQVCPKCQAVHAPNQKHAIPDC